MFQKSFIKGITTSSVSQMAYDLKKVGGILDWLYFIILSLDIMWPLVVIRSAWYSCHKLWTTGPERITDTNSGKRRIFMLHYSFNCWRNIRRCWAGYSSCLQSSTG